MVYLREAKGKMTVSAALHNAKSVLIVRRLGRPVAEEELMVQDFKGVLSLEDVFRHKDTNKLYTVLRVYTQENEELKVERRVGVDSIDDSRVHDFEQYSRYHLLKVV